MNTGDAWKQADSYFRQRVDDLLYSGKQTDKRHFLVLVNALIDNTLSDLLGRLPIEPVLFSLANILEKKRRSPNAWVLAGILPAYPKLNQEKAADYKSAETRTLAGEFYHKCLRVMFQQLLNHEESKQGYEMYVTHLSGAVYVHFKLIMLLGYAEGHDKALGHMSCYSSNLQRVTWDCNMPQATCDDADAICEPVVASTIIETVRQAHNDLQLKEHRTVTAARESLKKISQNDVLSIFFDFDFCDDSQGIFGSAPHELLHAYLLGPMKKQLSLLMEMRVLPEDFIKWYQSSRQHDRPDIGDISQYPLLIDKAEFESRFRLLTMSARRQSDRDYPRTPFKNGVTDLTRLNSQEYPGLVMLSMEPLKGLFHNGTCANDSTAQKLERKVANLLFQSLSLYEMMTLEEPTDSYLELLLKRTRHYLKNFKTLLGPTAASLSNVGLKFVKFHSPLHIPRQIQRFGRSHNFFGGFLEHALKHLVKKPARHTSRRQDRLNEEVCKQVYLG